VVLAGVVRKRAVNTSKSKHDTNYLIKKSTCKRSSKSRAASFFMADAFSWNRRIVPRPKVGIRRYLFTSGLSRTGLSKLKDLPPIQSLNAVQTSNIQHSHEMGKNCFPDSELEFMKEVGDYHGKKIESELK
jgi:hypothetical protein